MERQILCIGSINIDEVYSVPHIVRAGETITTLDRREIAGGKGMEWANFCVAAAKAGASVHMGAQIGKDGVWIRDLIAGAGVNVDNVMISETPTGRAVIQVERDTAENCIFLFKGANHSFQVKDIQNLCRQFSPGDWLAMPNETNHVDEAIRQAKACGMHVLWNPSPMTPELVEHYPMGLVDILVVNESELDVLAAQIGLLQTQQQQQQQQQQSGRIGNVAFETQALHVQETLGIKVLVVTRGKTGSFAVLSNPGASNPITVSVGMAPVPAGQVKDTTAAGDTWLGYFLATLIRKIPPVPSLSMSADVVQDAMITASYASGIGVTRHGAIPSIPSRAEVERFLETSQL
ncbi:putative ribokinase [Spiromyces aspiralis]|uniref:Ribokinase n=1 Tax=Spiromyces aspiralis TaxID=68401 RepID=A0ACC1HYF2_9FUNG|nr:putative ribokinase [Spiromyces aspiralis]